MKRRTIQFVLNGTDSHISFEIKKHVFGGHHERSRGCPGA